MSRYSRQISVTEFGEAGQLRLANAAVLIVGAGGLASPVLQYLAGAGLGHIRLVDGDVVSEDNIHRQTIYRGTDVGVPKVMAAAAHMQGLNPDCAITPVMQPLGPDNIAAHAKGVDLVLDCADSFAVSYSLSDFCHAQIPLIHASVVGMAGYVGGFCGTAPSLRAVFPDLPERFGSCAEDGVLGPVVGVIGAIQAQMALSMLIGQTLSPMGQLVTYDAEGNRFGGFRFDHAPEPETQLDFISPSQIDPRDMVIDLRMPDEGPLVSAGAQRISVEQIPRLDVGDAPRVVLCCRSGQRAWTAAQMLGASWHGEIALIAVG